MPDLRALSDAALRRGMRNTNRTRALFCRMSGSRCVGLQQTFHSQAVGHVTTALARINKAMFARSCFFH